MRFILISIILFSMAFSGTAGATFPSRDIAYWDEKERNDPDYIEIHKHADAGEWDQALNLLGQKITKNPKETTPLLLKGFVLNETGRYQEALDFFKQGAALERTHPSINFGNCQLYRNLGKADFAIRGCEIAHVRYPDNPQILFQFSETLATQGKMKEAISKLKKAAELDPKSPDYPFNMGMHWFYLNDLAQAEKSFERVLSIEPNHWGAHYQLGYLNALLRKKDKSRRYLLKLVQSAKDDPNLQSAKNLLDYLNKDALEKLPTKTDPYGYHMQRSQAMYRAGKYGLSLLEIETASRLRPDDRKTLEILVGMYSVLLRLKETETSVNRLLELGKDDKVLVARSYQELGDTQLMMGKFEEAKKFYQKSREMGDPDNLAKISQAEFPKITIKRPDSLIDEIYFKPTDALNRKGEIFSRYGMYDRATAIFAMILQMDPDHLMAKLNLGTAYYHQKEYNRAITLLEKTLVTHRNHEHLLAHLVLLAQAYVENGDNEPAVRHLRQAVQLNPAVKKALRENPVFKKLQSDESYKDVFH